MFRNKKAKDLPVQQSFDNSFDNSFALNTELNNKIITCYDVPNCSEKCEYENEHLKKLRRKIKKFNDDITTNLKIKIDVCDEQIKKHDESEKMKDEYLEEPKTEDKMDDKIEEKIITEPVDKIDDKIESKKTTEIYEFDELIINLKILGQLKKYEKFIYSNDNLIIDNRWFKDARRMFWGGGSRDETYEILKKIINSANIYSENFIETLKTEKNEDIKHNLKILTQELISSRIGFRNLFITYSIDETILSKLDLCYDGLIVRINKNSSICEL
jgi:hypothetical protein